MRKIRQEGAFKKDLKREKKGKYRKNVVEELSVVVTLLAKDEPLPQRYVDHSLYGDWADFRDCHIRPDLVLIYRKDDENNLYLVRLGSHSKLGF